MPSQQDIERLAYQLWERDGRPEGNHLAHYYEAERVLATANKPKRAAARKATTAKSRATRKAA